MTILLAPDSFKGSMTASEVCDAVERGLRRVWPEAAIVKVPMADGGEGTVQSLVDATGGKLIEADVSGPLGDRVRARYGVLGDGRTAVIEMAAASGLPLLPPERGDPKRTTTRGTGELIRHALDAGCRRFVLGIGGSATNDGGAGMAQALGARLVDSRGRELGPGGAQLADLDRVDLAGLDGRARAGEFTVACDVDNPLCGPRGAAAVYGPQKGASEEDVRLLDAALAHFAALLERDLGAVVADLPGAGAAGGLGAGLVAFLGARLVPGVDLVIEATGLDAQMARADLVVTGEGRIDEQTVFGKTIQGVARIAQRHGVPVIALAGSAERSAEVVLQHGVHGIFPILPGPRTLEEAMREGPELVELAAGRLARLLSLRRAPLTSGQPEAPAPP